ncbi:MAG: aminotransferase class V-fold PLP-dependent enzyme [Planctomycetaceae bacterium]|nr:aminotransferase class V-fold PLP-dependent enzyme [Planctomycetaceae bacterium]
MTSRIYLDHAATSAPKPAQVAQRLSRYFLEEGFTAGRGSYARAAEMEREVSVARAALAVLLGAESPVQILFTHSGTESLNLAIQGILGPGDHVVTTILEHNSVLRPLAALSNRGQIDVSYVEPNAAGVIDPQEISRAMRSETKLVCVVHISNVLGTIQPVQEICELAREHGAYSLIDASQSVGHLPIDVKEMGCDLLAAPAHKGLLAPLGTGILYVKPGIENELQPLLFGGTGTKSESPMQPDELPSRYESGSLNVPGIIGLAAALEVVTPEFVVQESARQAKLTEQLIEGLSKIPGLKMYPFNASPTAQAGVVSLSIAQHDPRVIGTILDEHFQIEVRTGFHCAPKTHDWLKTAPLGGTVRISIGHTTTEQNIKTTIAALQEISVSMG